MCLWGLVPLSAPTRRALLATAAALTLLLAGCNAADDAGPDGDAPPPGEDLPEVAADFGGAAEMNFPDSGPPEGLQVEVLEEGDGEQVPEGAVVTADYAGHVWGSPEPFDSSFARGQTALFPLSGVVQGWSEGIPGNPVGSRLLISIPPELGYGPGGGNPEAGIGPEDTIVFVVDVHDVIDPDAAGDPDATVVTEEDELPITIDGDLGSPAWIDVREDADQPDEPELTAVAEGSGDTIAAGSTVVINYTLSTWDNSQQESTWPEFEGGQPGPEVGQVGAGQWFDLLIDATEGSRVLVTFPGDDTQPGLAMLADIVHVQNG